MLLPFEFFRCYTHNLFLYDPF